MQLLCHHLIARPQPQRNPHLEYQSKKMTLYNFFVSIAVVASVSAIGLSRCNSRPPSKFHSEVVKGEEDTTIVLINGDSVSIKNFDDKRIDSIVKTYCKSPSISKRSFFCGMGDTSYFEMIGSFIPTGYSNEIDPDALIDFVLKDSTITIHYPLKGDFLRNADSIAFIDNQVWLNREGARQIMFDFSSIDSNTNYVRNALNIGEFIKLKRMIKCSNRDTFYLFICSPEDGYVLPNRFAVTKIVVSPRIGIVWFELDTHYNSYYYKRSI